MLVTGATGFIGSHLVRRLCRLGAEVHAVSRRPPASSHGELWHSCDLTVAHETAALMRKVHPGTVFHLASTVTGERDVRLVLPTVRDNLASVVNLLTVATELPGTRIVLAGSVEEPRDADPTPQSPYAAAKWAATGYARMFHRLWNVPVTVLRVAMVYGPGQRDVDKLVPHVTLSLLRGRRPQVTSGERLVDWVYVDDVVEAFLAAGTSGRAPGGVFDVGGGTQVSIRETVELLAKVVGGPARPSYGAVRARPMDIPQVSDITSTTEVIRWHPTTDLEEGLRRTVAWYADQLSGPMRP